MACLLTRGRALNCKDVVGGIKTIYFVDFGTLGTLTEGTSGDEGVLTDCTGTFTAYQYDLKSSANTMETAVNSSRDNGTSFFGTTLSVSLPKITKEDNVQLKLLSYSRPHIVVEDRNSNFFLLGAENGCELVGGGISSGGSFDSMSGYTMEFLSEESKPPLLMESAATNGNPFAGCSSATPTVTVGTNS